MGLGLLTVLMTMMLPKNDLKAVTSYKVDPVSLELTLTDGESGRHDRSIWHQIVSLLPNEHLRQNVTRFHLFSDGLQDTLAYVKKTDHGSNHWTLAVDRTDYRRLRDYYFTSTMVHEFAHLISLNTDQIAHFQWGCSSLVTPHGCFKNDAYLNIWYKQFWAGELEDAHHRMVASVEKGFRDNAQERFYKTYSDSFVSEYASFNVSEDFAETFADYILEDIPADGELVYQQKLRFFGQFPEFVAMRKYIRSKLKQ